MEVGIDDDWVNYEGVENTGHWKSCMELCHDSGNIQERTDGELVVHRWLTTTSNYVYICIYYYVCINFIYIYIYKMPNMFQAMY